MLCIKMEHPWPLMYYDRTPIIHECAFWIGTYLTGKKYQLGCVRMPVCVEYSNVYCCCDFTSVSHSIYCDAFVLLLFLGTNLTPISPFVDLRSQGMGCKEHN